MRLPYEISYLFFRFMMSLWGFLFFSCNIIIMGFYAFGLKEIFSWDFLLLAAWIFSRDFLTRLCAFCSALIVWDFLMKCNAFCLAIFLKDFLSLFHAFMNRYEISVTRCMLFPYEMSWDFLMRLHGVLDVTRFLYELTCFLLQNWRRGLGRRGWWNIYVEKGLIIVGCEWRLSSVLAMMRFPRAITWPEHALVMQGGSLGVFGLVEWCM